MSLILFLSFVFFYTLLCHSPFSHPISWVFLLLALPTSVSSLSWPLAKNSSLSSMKTPTLMNIVCLSLTHKQTMRTHKILHTHTKHLCSSFSLTLKQQDNTVILGSGSKTHSICLNLSLTVHLHLSIFWCCRKHRYYLLFVGTSVTFCTKRKDEGVVVCLCVSVHQQVLNRGWR